MDHTRVLDYNNDAYVGNFIGRRERIAVVNWTVGGTISYTNDPLYEYLNTSTIKNKLENYRFMSATLCLEFQINGTPFYYGAALASYRPLKSWTEDISGTGDVAMNGRTQRPHVKIFPSTSQGGELKIPFFYHKNYVDVTLASEVRNYGELRIDSFTNLSIAAATTNALDITVWAWLEDVKLYGPTMDSALQGQSHSTHVEKSVSFIHADGELYKVTYYPFTDRTVVAKLEKDDIVVAAPHTYTGTPQGTLTQVSFVEIEGKTYKVEYDPVTDTEKIYKFNYTSLDKAYYYDERPQGDEYADKGPVSYPASVVVAASKQLQKVPVIKPFARATEIVATGVRDIANLLGFTKVPNAVDTQAVKSIPFAGSATTDLSDCIDPLTLESKQGTTIDPRTVGLNPEDEMSISNFIRREAYLTQFTWALTSAVDTTLFRINVGPNVISANSATDVRGTPLAHVSQMFKYWRGDIVYKFTFVMSQYHRGRVQFYFEPARTAPGLSMSTQYNKVFSIDDNPEIEITVPYMSDRSYMKVDHNWATTHYGSGVVAPSPDYFTGQLLVAVSNPLTINQAGADIQVLVSVRAGDNFEFAAPRNLPSTYHFTADPQGYDPYGYPVSSLDEDMYRMGTAMVDLGFWPSQEDLETCYKWPYAKMLAYMMRKYPRIRVDATSRRLVDEFETNYKYFDCKPQGDAVPNNILFNSPTSATMFETKDICPENALIHFGENVVSLRAILRRMCLSHSIKTTTNTTNFISLTTRFGSRYPLFNGYDANGLTPTGLNLFNYVQNIPFNWISVCYVGSRGSVDWAVDVDHPVPITIKAYRQGDISLTTGGYYSEASSSGGVNQYQEFFVNNVRCGWDGQALMPQRSQGGFRVNIPFYNRNRMRNNKPSLRNLGQGEDDSNTDAWTLKLVSKPTNSTTYSEGSVTHLYCAAGHDYTCFFYLNTPRVYIYSIPAPT